jgi:hypothetical protein
LQQAITPEATMPHAHAHAHALLAAGAAWPGSAALAAGGLAWLAHVALDGDQGFGQRTLEVFQRG